MPFELTHLVIGLQAIKNESSSFIAGLVYPDIRYPAGIERRLTHDLEAYDGCSDQDFILGVKCHLTTDKIWDELVLGLNIPNPDTKISTAAFIGGLKLIHDRVAAQDIFDKAKVVKSLKNFTLPSNLPINEKLWQEWAQAMANYVNDGPTDEGIRNIVIKMRFQTLEEINPRLDQLNQIYPSYKNIFEKIHLKLVERVRYAGIT